MTAARRVSGASRNGSRGSGGGRSGAGRPAEPPVRDYDPKAVRAWAEKDGLEVSHRGRVPADLVAKSWKANA